MDTIFGYVTYIYDDNTVKVYITDSKITNGHQYAKEEKVKLLDWRITDKSKGTYDLRINLIYNLLHRKVRVDVMGLNTLDGINGRVTILSDSEKIAS